METRSNFIWVGAVTLALLAALAIFIVWLAGLDEGSTKEYDVLFEQSVEGLAIGSQVTFSGVPAGQVTEIELYEKNPEFVRVRIKIDEKVPILIGTTATIQSSFTGVAKILLDGAVSGRPEIDCETTACPEGKPVIPPQAGGLGALLNTAPVLLDRLATLSERLNQLLSDENQRNISAILANTNRMTGSLADASPELQGTLVEFRATLAQASESLAAFEKTMQSTDRLLAGDGQPLAQQLRATLASAQQAAQALERTLASTEPATRKLAETTLPAAEATMRDLRETSAALRAITEKLDDQGAGALLGGSKLPDYEP
ncbi:MAG TPA: MlaD family protein [Sphingomonadaceae bacterium]|nr:MlaD family protein [Sphingomonadaceae bacterium]